MDTEQEVWRLAGEAIAVQSVLVGICMGLDESGDAGRFIVNNAFSYAEAVAEAGSLKMGDTGSAAHLAAQLGVIEQLRKAIFGEGGGPQAAV